ncbi:hypothetical protein Agabi119p4_1876 [Agaricus bisporus var. burnettii]|uniref:Carboxymuconolactone decarboxylase-like domain-containing protein n=1 Tax=Agaricus bisporus var. burnettii TaxID=192524 RepID=A0A8H7F869_AGABI|nr:hypothetical protein Agabi119p4_1876 [Agaricus bisporus var. burnettii]
MHLSSYLPLILSLIFFASAIPITKRDDNLPARVPYVFPEPGTNEIADEIRARRVNGTLLALDGVLLNAPLVAQSWNGVADVIRNHNTIPGAMRELFILRIAALNDAAYEWIQHEPVGRSEGLTSQQLRAIRLTPAFKGTVAEKVLGAEFTAALDFCDWITKSVDVPDRVFKNLRRFLNDQQMVEATATNGFYAFVSRFVESLDVDGKVNTAVPIP